ncbi:MAG: molybdopterin-dependent oxidoreductase [Eubacteriaceae bacterium]|nr:molybdopterin-dependent oxidoreductase [Eubacteriaceae bacterium]
MSFIRLNINGKEVTGNSDQTILEIAKENGIEIPTMCYDERVEIYGSCGLCVVEVEGIPKLLRSCATKAADGMIVNTNTARTKASRKTALDLLLSDHIGDCKAPCVLACPGSTDCQGYVGLIANGQFREALELIKEQLPLPAAIGRVCPHPCETACRRQLVEEPISIAWLKRFVADIDLADKDLFIPDIAPSTGKKIGVIGGGPGGLSAAYYLLAAGHAVTIYDQMPKMGGMLRYGIPQYRLPKDIVDQEVGVIEKMGAKLVNNVKIGRDVDFDYLRSQNDAMYVAVGAWTSSKMRTPGENLEGVIGGIDFLRKATLNENMEIGDKVAVVGGGNTAMDACRTAVRLGAKEVYILYRRTKEEMPAEEIEIVEAEEEGVIFKFLVAPMEIIEDNGKAAKIKLQKMELGEADASGRRRPVPIEGEIEILDVDLIIAAIGQGVDLTGLESIEATKWNTIATDESTFLTSLTGVFAGGDAINDGAGIAIEAIGDAKKAADVINKYLQGETVPYVKPYYVTREDVTEQDFKDKKIAKRPHMGHLKPEERKRNFEEIVDGYTPEQAIEDAKRCLECGCGDVFECKLVEYANDYNVTPEIFAGETHNRQVGDGHPFIIRNTDKCILCGLCVRVCDEVMDNGALGLVSRGFDTVVKPSLDLPLCDTVCISCGQCVSVCPVGAIQERLKIDKSVPVHQVETKTVCSFCSVGCNINIQTKGDKLYRALPDKDSTVDNGLLCVKGRFGYDASNQKTRIISPMVRKDGKLVETSWEEALRAAGKKMQSIKMLGGGKAVAIAVSDRYTNEEIFLAKKLGSEYLGTDNITSFNRTYGGIKDVLGYDASTNTFEEIKNTDMMLLIGGDVMKDHTIAALKIKEAVANGSKLVVVNDINSQADDWAVKKIDAENDLNLLKGILKALLDAGCAPANANGLDELKGSLGDLSVSEAALGVADMYKNAKKPMIIFDQNYVTADGAKLIADIAVVSGNIGKARRGIIQLKPKNNSQGIADMGIDKDNNEVLKGMASKEIKGLMVFGEDISAKEIDDLEFLVVQDLYMTPTAEKADVVLPAVSYAESEGTFTNSERRIQKVRKAIPALSSKENWKVISDLMVILGRKAGYASAAEITEELSKAVPEYSGVYMLEGSVIWPKAGPDVLYTGGFATESKKADLAIVNDGPMFMMKESTDFVEKEFGKVVAAI